MITLQYESLLEFLKSKSLDPKIQPETNQIYIKFKINQLDIPVFFRIFEESELLQLLAFVPGKVKSESEGETARILHLINKELDIPGFGMDESVNALFYRAMLFAKNEEIDETLIESYINSIQLICDTFTPIILAVATGQATYNDILDKLQEQEKSK